MSYKNSTLPFPEDLLEQIQEYVEGKVIYIPKKQEHKKQWGANTDTKSYLSFRNCQIHKDFLQGMSIAELSEKYCLTEKSIRRILNAKSYE